MYLLPGNTEDVFLPSFVTNYTKNYYLLLLLLSVRNNKSKPLHVIQVQYNNSTCKHSCRKSIQLYLKFYYMLTKNNIASLRGRPTTFLRDQALPISI
jgi:hypothetical protein